MYYSNLNQKFQHCIYITDKYNIETFGLRTYKQASALISSAAVCFYLKWHYGCFMAVSWLFGWQWSPG